MINKCRSCSILIKEKDVVALNKKLINKDMKNYYCLTCLSEYFGVTEDDLLNKIEEFKEDDCKLFK